MFHTAYPVEIVQIPGRMFQFYDFFYTHRVIWTDGREVPKDPDPLWYGSSVGKWDGDTFVVDTVGFNDKSWLDADGHPHSEDMHVQERYHRVDHDTIEVNLTLTDPKAYTTPWVSETKVWKAAPKVEIREDICAPSDEEKYKEEMRVPAGVAGELSNALYSHAVFDTELPLQFGHGTFGLSGAVIQIWRCEMKNVLRKSLVAIAGLLAFSAPILAHHGSRVSYDMKKEVTAKGVVTEYQYQNPHIYIMYDEKDDAGNIVRWNAGDLLSFRDARTGLG